MAYWYIYFTVMTVHICGLASAVRLHKLFQFIDGYKSDHYLRGFLHIGDQYAVFLKLPKPHAKELVYELYETKNVEDLSSYQPRLLAVSKIPIDYIKEQLIIYRSELYRAKYVDGNAIPGVQVKTLREWQIDKMLQNNDGINLDDTQRVLRTKLN